MRNCLLQAISHFLSIFSYLNVFSTLSAGKCGNEYTNRYRSFHSTGDNLFVSTLDEKSKVKAKKELNELNDKDRVLAVQTLRKWILDRDWLKSRTDFEFLLRFLRTRKFSQLGARQTIENYWTSKTNIPSIYRDIDPEDPVIQEIIRAGWVYSHKTLDPDGIRYIFMQPGALGLDRLKEIGTTGVYKAFVLAFDWLMFDENSQVNGVRIFIDYTNMGWQHYLIFATIDEQKSLQGFYQKSLAVRVKGIFFYNEPGFFDVMLNFVKPFLTEKVMGRMTMLGDKLTKLYEMVDASVIPDDYLPDGTTGAGPKEKIIEDMIEDMTAPKFREYILDVTSEKYKIDIEKRNNMAKEPANSFRKLNVD